MTRMVIAQVISKRTRKVIQVLGRFTDGDKAWRALDRHAKVNGFKADSPWRYRLLPVSQ